jgi:hypothetical protein
MVWPFPANDPVLPPAVEEFYENLFRLLSDEAEQIEQYPEPLKSMMIAGFNGDQNPGAKGPFGTSATNPIPVNGPLGQILYLSSLRQSDQRILFHRLGSTEDIDIFECVNLEGTDWTLLYLDMYHPRKSRRAPEGYSIAADNVLISGVTYEVADFPRSLYGGIVEYSEKRFGISIADPLVRIAIEGKSFTRWPPPLHRPQENESGFVPAKRNIVQELTSATTDAQHDLYETLMKFNEWEVDGKSQLPTDEIALTEITFLPIAMAVRLLFDWHPGDPTSLADEVSTNVLTENIDGGSLEMTMPEATLALERGYTRYQELLDLKNDDPTAFAMRLSQQMIKKQNYLVGMMLAAKCAIHIKAMKQIIAECTD